MAAMSLALLHAMASAAKKKRRDVVATSGDGGQPSIADVIMARSSAGFGGGGESGQLTALPPVQEIPSRGSALLLTGVGETSSAVSSGPVIT